MTVSPTRWIVAAIAIALIAALWWVLQTHTGVQQRQFTDLPWQAEVLDDDRLRVLGFTLGKSTPAEYVARLPVPDIRLFVHADGESVLEAFYVNARIEPFEANLVARLDWPDDDLDWLMGERVSERPMPSGARRYGLSDAALSRMGNRPIVELSYVPRARWSEDQIRGFFGEPRDRLDIDRNQSYWLYPDRATAIMVPRRGRVLMHFTTPSRFDDAVERLALLAESRLEMSAPQNGESDTLIDTPIETTPGLRPAPGAENAQ